MGGGGREHALAWRLAQDGHEVVAAPGNPGLAQIGECFPVEATDIEGQCELARQLMPNLIVVGPEDPLIAGLADALREDRHDVFGPSAKAARLEGSKAFSKEMMRAAGVRTAAFGTFTDAYDAIEYANTRYAKGFGVVVKASGAALGKGVTVCDSFDEAREAIQAALVAKAFGEAGSTIVIEDRLNGPEFSLLTVCSAEGIFSLPVAQDHKRIFDGDQGPNTGGMGTYSPVDRVDSNLVRLTEYDIVKPMLTQMRMEGCPFGGLLFSGLMLHDGEPYCLEYNVRFGDPETQSVMLRLGKGLGNLLKAAARNEPLPDMPIQENAACTVVAASAGYPASSQKGVPIQVGELPQGVHLFHAGTRLVEDLLVTNGGRVLAISASAKTLADARRLAYQGMEAVKFEGMQFRTDIAVRTSA